MLKIVRHIVLLGAVLAAVGAGAGYLAVQRYGVLAYRAAGLAVAINWLAGSLALAVVGAAPAILRMQAALGAMLIRMALPLAAIVYFTQSRHPLMSQGAPALIAGLYLVGLVVETALTVRLASRGLAPPVADGSPSLPAAER